ncbi:MAG: HesA/MoeB/ThiF family protein [Alloprevotella sp.]
MDSERYSRQTGLPEIGPQGQAKISRARVLIVGVGGLGSPISLYLAGAGVGHIGLVDDDVVSPSNLHRQVLYTTAETGQSKAAQAAQRLTALNPEVEIKALAVRLTEDNAEEIVRDYDIVVDGCDNYATRYIIDDVCRRLGKPYVYGAVCGFEGQASVFHATPSSPGYRNLYPTPPPPPASKALVGMTPGVVGSILAHETLKLICGYGPTLDGRLWTINLLTMESFTLAL